MEKPRWFFFSDIALPALPWRRFLKLKTRLRDNTCRFLHFKRLLTIFFSFFSILSLFNCYFSSVRGCSHNKTEKNILEERFIRGFCFFGVMSYCNTFRQIFIQVTEKNQFLKTLIVKKDVWELEKFFWSEDSNSGSGSGTTLPVFFFFKSFSNLYLFYKILLFLKHILLLKYCYPL